MNFWFFYQQMHKKCVLQGKYWSPTRWAFLCILLAFQALAEAKPQEIGVMDLKDWNPKARSMLLEGTWKFFPGQLLSPKDARDRSEQGLPIKVPGAWNEIERAPGSKMGAHGFGTYLMKLQNIPIDVPLALRLQYATSSYRLYWLSEGEENAEVLLEAGRVGTTEATSLPQFIERLRGLGPVTAGQSAWVIVQVANFHWVHGGMFYAPELGDQTTLDNAYNGRFMSSLILVGMFTILMLFNLSIFFRQRNEVYTLWLALVSFVACLTTSTFSSQIFYFVLEPSVRVHQLFRYGNSAFGVLVLTIFNELIRSQFPKQSKRWVGWLTWGCAFFSHVVYIWFPFNVPIPILRANQALALVFPFLIVAQLWQAFRDGEENSGISLLGFSIFFATIFNDLLSVFRIVTLPPLSNWGLLVMIFLQSQIQAIRFAHLFNKTRRMSEALADLNHSLEHRVAQQTREIRSILSHVRMGIFGLISPQKKIAPNYSQFLEKILEGTELEGRLGLELLLSGAEISPDEKDQIDQVFNVSLGESVMNFQFNEHLLPKFIRRRDTQGIIHQFEVTWDAIANDADQVEMILITVNDVTELRKLEGIAQRKAVELEMVGEILENREEDFRRLVRNAHELLDHSQSILQTATDDVLQDDILRLVLFNLHTLKGAARTLHFSRLAQAIHGLESKYRLVKSCPTATLSIYSLGRDLDRIAMVVMDYELIASQKLKLDILEAKTVKVRADILKSSFRSLKQVLARSQPDDVHELAALYNLLQEVNEYPLSKLLSQILQHSSLVASDLGKPAPRIELEVPLLSCDSATEDLLRKIFVHIVRNALDHGIEGPDKRLTLGKPATGVITVKAEVQGEWLNMDISDDGNGLDLQKLSVKAEERGLPTEPDESKLADLIFSEGVSTASAPTDISGMGIGMAAVREFLQKNGGSISVVLLTHQSLESRYRPFLLRIRLPMHGFSASPFPALEKSLATAS